MRLPHPIRRAFFSVALVTTIFLAAVTTARTADASASPSAAVASSTAKLACVPARLRFGKVAVGHTGTLAVTLTNIGGASITLGSSITISQTTVVGTGFSVSGLNLPLVLSNGSAITFRAAFTPQSAGFTQGTIYIVSNASNPVLTIPLSGTGTNAGQLSITPATMNFGNVPVGSNEQQVGTLSAAGSAVTISSGAINNSEFILSGLSLPMTIPSGQSVSFAVTFTPQNSSSASGTLTFVSDATNSPTVETLTGTGTAGYTVGLSWDASTSQNVAGYNIYRGNTSGGPYSKINSVLDPNTAYTDSSVVDGQTYYYVTTTVNSSGEESGYSNEAQAVVP